ncbi:NAD-dependent protein deacetylase [Nymphon striatum]|nr:NAD-dependent protein deacetylase [Nymphon striatum]
MTTIQTLSTSHLVKSCGGTLMPDVVFFGGVVPKARVDEAFDSLADADCVLVVGSSLKVYSGFRFPRWAHQNNLPLYAINQGEMRGEDMFDLVVPESCEEILPQLVIYLPHATNNTESISEDGSNNTNDTEKKDEFGVVILEDGSAGAFYTSLDDTLKQLKSFNKDTLSEKYRCFKSYK